MDLDIKQNAEYCLNCKTKPCSLKGCPLNNDIPEFITAVKNQNFKEAYEILLRTTVFPAICGRICPHYKQCMGSCIRGIKGNPVDIGKLEDFVGNIAIQESYKIEKQQNQNKNVAIVGGGPSGLTAAAFLAKKGNKVTIYEKYNYLGGLLIHGIPEFRLPKDVVEKSIQKILELGIEVKYNQELGKDIELEALESQYDIVVLACGANASMKMNIEGEELEGVYGGNELLEYNSHPNYKSKKVVVVGGGNVAMDTARTIKRLGAEKVTVIYRRTREEMPAEQKEVEEAILDGVEFLFQTNVERILGKNKVEKVELIKTKKIKDEKLPINLNESNYEIDADFVIMAIGSQTEGNIKKLGLELTENGYIKTDADGRTSKKRVFAIGDLSGAIKTVAWAARSGRNVSDII